MATRGHPPEESPVTVTAGRTCQLHRTREKIPGIEEQSYDQHRQLDDLASDSTFGVAHYSANRTVVFLAEEAPRR